MTTSSDRHAAVDGLVDSIKRASRGDGGTAQGERRMIYATGENTRHIRHDQLLARWPILAEPWAQRVEETRLGSIDRTPGAATFGR